MPLPLLVLAPATLAGSAATATAAYKVGAYISQTIRGIKEDRARAELLRRLEKQVSFRVDKKHVVFTWLNFSSLVPIKDFLDGKFIAIRDQVLLDLNIQAGEIRGPISTEVMKAVEMADRQVASYINV